MTMVWRNVHSELARAPAEQMALARIGGQFSAEVFGVERAVQFREREKIPIKTAGEAFNSPGGAVVGEETESGFMSFRKVEGVIRRYAGVKTMGSDSRSFPRSIGGITATFTPENQEGVETEGLFDAVKVQPRKSFVYTRGSTELFEDAAPAIAEWAIEEVGSALVGLEDLCGWLGDGSAAHGKMVGICTKLTDGNRAGAVTASAGHDMAAKIDSADLGALIGRLPEEHHPGAKFYASSAGIGALIRLGATPFGVTETAYGVRPMLQIGGFEIVPARQMAGATSASGKVMLAFGDLRKTVAFGERRGVNIKVSTQRHIERDQIAMRATARFEIVAHNMGDATTAGAMVGLLGA